MSLAIFAKQSTSNAGYSGERCLNLFIRATQEGVSDGTLLGRGGAIPVVDLGGPVRALIDFKGVLYAIAGGYLNRITGSDFFRVGAVGTSEDVSVVRTNKSIVMLVGGKYYVSDGATVKRYDTGPVETPLWLAAMSGFVIAVGDGQGRGDVLAVSGLDDATTFAGLDFAAAESSPDKLVAAIADHGELWLFGSETIEIWYNSGDADFPFAPNSGAKIERGCLAGNTVAKEDNAVFFVGNDLIVYRATGVAPTVISTREVEEAIRKKSVHSAFTFEERGHKFYAVRMLDGPTWVYDMTTLLWHERSTGTLEAPWFATCGIRSGVTQYIGTDTGKIITLDENTFTDEGQTIVAEAISAPEYRADEFSISRVHAQLGGGTLLNGRKPRVSLQTSRDGRNWSNERWRDMGGLGEYNKSVEWHGLGAFQRFQVRIRITDPVSRDIHGVKYDAA